MIRDSFQIPRYRWTVVMYYGADRDDAEELLHDLRQAGCAGDFLRTAREQLHSGNLNTGMTYTNYGRRLTLISIGRATSPLQLLNTLQHEQRHLETHIATACHLDPFGEEICYLAGYVAEKTFPRMFEMEIRSELPLS